MISAAASAPDAMRRHPLEADLRAIVGDRGLLTGADVAARSCDPFRHRPIGAPLIVRPADTQEVAAVMRLCAAHGQKIVTQGGMTGVSGGAYADAAHVALSLERMTRIESIDAEAGVAVVEAGVPIAALQDAAGAHGLTYPLDLISQGTATVGGTISTNAGGNRVIRWGMTRAQVLGLEVVLADGSILPATNRLVKNNTGYDLKQLFIGGEGTLGIITRAVLRLVPRPTTQAVCFASVESYEKVVALLHRAKRLPILSAFEVMWRDYYEMMVESGTGRDPLPANQPFFVLIEALGHDPDVDETLMSDFLQDIHDERLVADAVLASSDRQRQELWRVREGAEILVAQMSPFLSPDLSVDIRHTAACVEAIRTLVSGFPGGRIVTFGHLGDNNIHICVHAGPDGHALEGLEDAIFRIVARYGGSISAEHGIGRVKRDYLHYSRSPEELRMMRLLKHTLDPGNLLNPDVLFADQARP
jgi:FAD/FMN-containing dehydrogenase